MRSTNHSRGMMRARASAPHGAEGITKMASRSADEAATPQPAIIAFIPRQRVRQQVRELVAAMAAETAWPCIRRMLAEAEATFGADLVTELRRVSARDPQSHAHIAVQLLLMLANDDAQEALWAIGHDPAFAPALRLQALRGLCQQGAQVPIRQLVELANACERHGRTGETAPER